jgi:antitoxin component of MazEF toxin-antitoxin module
MATKIVRVGNTLMVEIPEELAAKASLAEGEAVEWAPNGNGGIALVKQSDSATPPRKRKTLEELLEGIPEGTRIPEYDWGPPRGKEVW